MTRARWSSPAPRAVRCGGATSTRCPPGRTRSRRSACPACTTTTLRHAGNQFAAHSGARLRDLMARMGHDSERAAMIQHQAQGADTAITNAIDTHVQAEQTKRGDDRTGLPASWSPLANGPLMTGRYLMTLDWSDQASRRAPLTCAFRLERVTGIEPALSAWEADVLPLNYTRADLHCSAVRRLHCVRPDIVPDPIGCQGAPLRS